MKIPPNHLIPPELDLSDELLIKVAQRYGTPLYLYDANVLKKRWFNLRHFLPEKVSLYYSVKANSNTAIIDVFRRLGASFEAASPGEIRAVRQKSIFQDKVIYVGPGKTTEALQQAIQAGVHIIIAESAREVRRIQEICKSNQRRTKVALRLNPGKGSGIIAMGGQTQFGMEFDAVLDLLAGRNEFLDIEFVGIQAYLGTGILDEGVFIDHTQTIFDAAVELQSKSGIKFEFVDIGGGLGIPYFDGDQALDLESMRSPFARLVQQYLEKNPDVNEIGMEAGRFLAGPAGVFLARVIDIKENGGKKFIILDGGTNIFGGDNRYRGFRPTPMRIVGKPDHDVTSATVCGPLCTSADRLASDVDLPCPEIGDIAAFYQAGAYGLNASPGLFLSFGFPKELMIDNDKIAVIREGMTPESLLREQPVDIAYKDVRDNL